MKINSSEVLCLLFVGLCEISADFANFLSQYQPLIFDWGWKLVKFHTNVHKKVYSVTSPGTVCDALHEVPTAEWRQVVDAEDKYGDEFGQKDVVIAERYIILEVKRSRHG